MPKFSDDLAQAVRVQLKDLLRFESMGGKILWVKKVASTGYHEFKKQHPDYEDGALAVYNTVTAGIAALNDYDVLMITPGNYDEAAKMELSGLKGVKIIGAGNGMQWGEGSTCIRNVVASTSDILDITGCQALEIEGIAFVQVGAYDAINFTGLNYSVRIHDCCFIGNPGTAIGLYGVNANGSNGPDTYIHDCKFFGWKTAGIVMGNQRNVIADCFFVIPGSAHGINLSGAAASGFNLIKNCDFLGSNSSDVGIYTATSVIGNWMAVNCRFAACAEAIQDAGAADSDQNVVDCRINDAGLGGIAGADPEA